MQNDTLQRLLALLEKAGDRIIVTDPAGEKPYVLMSLEQYEKLLGEGNSQNSVALKDAEVSKEPPPSMRSANRPSLRVAEDIDPPVDLGSARKKREIPLWKPSAPPKPSTGTDSSATQKEKSGSEEQFYLEPLE